MTRLNKYLFSRNSVIISLIFFICLFIVFYSHEDDSGDHIVGILYTIIVFVATGVILTESRFFEKSWITDKYETLTSKGIEFEEIESFVTENQYFESSSASLKDLALCLGLSSNVISKIINMKTGSHFNDYINRKRVDLAKEKLLADEYTHLTVEAIGNSVGFSSKSAFYDAFKKHVGLSPAAYVKGNKG